MKKAILFIFLALCFAGASAAVYFFGIVPNQERAHIAKNGVPGVGTVTAIRSNTEVNDEPRYRIEFTFVNAETGQKHNGRTADVYTYSELSSLGETVPIKYIGDRAVVMPYKASIMSWLGWILIAAFVAAALGLIVGAVLVIKFSKEASSIKKGGKDGTATFLSSSVGMYINNAPRYKIHYTYTDEFGEYHEGKTGSSYRQDEADAFQSMRTFPIRFAGKKSVILIQKKDLLAAAAAASAAQSAAMQNAAMQAQAFTQPQNPPPQAHPFAPLQAQETSQPQPQPTQQPTPFTQPPALCKFCNAAVTPDMKFCANCGAGLS
ncbi:MAG: zinc ribbon domain-containing protein [Firmicutes bacterium]|nr:zinc ribbon domain-containing protein [Bacillota bacterium]